MRAKAALDPICDNQSEFADLVHRNFARWEVGTSARKLGQSGHVTVKWQTKQFKGVD